MTVGTSEQRKDATGKGHIDSFSIPLLKLSGGTQIFKRMFLYALCMSYIRFVCVKYFIIQKGNNSLIHFKAKRRYFF